jgi:ribosomal protein L32
MLPKNSTCSRCGSARLIPGKVCGDVGFFQPSKIKKFFSLSGSVKLAATACLDCGTVDLTIDPVALTELAGEADEDGAAAT